MPYTGQQDPNAPDNFQNLAYDLNNQGDVIYFDGSAGKGLLYRNGESRQLNPLFGNRFLSPLALIHKIGSVQSRRISSPSINDLGDVLALVDRPDDNSNTRLDPQLYNARTNVLNPLELLNANLNEQLNVETLRDVSTSYNTGINESGQFTMGVTSTDLDRNPLATRFFVANAHDQSLHELETPGGAAGVIATGLNEQGATIGFSYDTRVAPTPDCQDCQPLSLHLWNTEGDIIDTIPLPPGADSTLSSDLFSAQNGVLSDTGLLLAATDTGIMTFESGKWEPVHIQGLPANITSLGVEKVNKSGQFIDLATFEQCLIQ